MNNKKSGSVAAVTRLADWRRSSGTSRVHAQQSISGQVVPFPGQGRNHHRPRRGRDAFALPPLADSPMTHPQITGHVVPIGQRVPLCIEGAPAIEHGIEGLHGPYLARDGLSRQGVPGFPVPSETPQSDNIRMGRARSPVQFNKRFAELLRAARVAARYRRAQDFARDLGIEYERYRKWEQGRTPIQHEHLARICELTGKDANYFYDIGPPSQEQRKTG